MSLATLPLPDDPTALRNLAVGLQAELARKDIEIAANAAEIHAKTLYIEKLKMQLKWPVSGESGRVHDPIATRPKHDLQRDR